VLVHDQSPIHAFAKVGEEDGVELVRMNCIAVIPKEYLAENAADSGEPRLRLDAAKVEYIKLPLLHKYVSHDCSDVRVGALATVA